MRAPPRVRLALVFAAGFAACPLTFWAFRLRAEGPQGEAAARPATRDPRLSEVLALTTLQFGGIGGGAVAEPREPTAVAYVVPPVTARAARTWEKIQKSVTISLKHEIPLEDFLKAVKNATKGPDDKGVQIYVDPLSLQEAEKTMTSPVTADFEDVPLTTVLSLTLKTIGLKYAVHQDGLLMIVNEDNENQVTDPSARILNELSEIREGLAALRNESRGQGPQSDALAKQVSDLRNEVESLRAEVGRRGPERESKPGTPKGAGGLR